MIPGYYEGACPLFYCFSIVGHINIVNIVDLILLGFELCREVLFDVESVSGVGIRKILVIRVLGDVVFVALERAHTAKL